MNVLIIHGDHSVKSFERLKKLKENTKSKNWTIETISPLESKSIIDILRSQNLFESKLVYLIKDSNSLKKEDTEWIKNNINDFKGHFVFYSPTKINKKVINSFSGKAKIEEFILPKTIWNFLDSFYPGNTKVCLKLLHKTIEDEPVEFVFNLLGGHVRDLYWIKEDPSTIKLAPWRLAKLKKQSEMFTSRSLRAIIENLSDVDVKAKTGRNLTDMLDLLIITELK